MLRREAIGNTSVSFCRYTVTNTRMKANSNRIEIAKLYGGGILMTTLILLFGYTTPRLLRRFARVLAFIRRRINA